MAAGQEGQGGWRGRWGGGESVQLHVLHGLRLVWWQSAETPVPTTSCCVSPPIWREMLRKIPPETFSVAYFMRCKPTKQKNQRVIERSSKARRRVIVYCCIQICSRVKTVRSLTIKTTSAHFVFNILAPCCLPNEYTNDDQREQNEDVGHSPCGGLFVPLFVEFFSVN